MLEKSDELREKFFDLQSPQDIANLLDVNYNHLKYYIYILPVSVRYRSFDVHKKTCRNPRTINAPNSHIKIVQQKLNHVLELVYKVKPSAHGFINHRSVVTNAKRHVRQRFVFNVDLKDFFATINFGRVRGMFMAKPYSLSAKVATVLGQICCHNNELPQGAPTSPTVSNMICSRLDSDLQRLAGMYYCTYTRYADDITFSKTSLSFPSGIGYVDSTGVTNVGNELTQIIETNGFKINQNKVRLQNNKTRQSVTGLTVNRIPNLPRKYVRQIRAMIHAWDKYGYDSADKEHAEKYYTKKRRVQGDVPSFAMVLKGKLEFLRMVKGSLDPVYKNLQSQLVKVDKDYIEFMKKENEKMSKRDVFISHASEDKDFVRPLAEELIRIGFSIWYDEYELTVGDKLLERIDDGLTKSRYGIVVLSKHFFKKEWTNKELGGLTAKEANGQKVILPLWHNITKEDVVKSSPILASIVAIITQTKSIAEIAGELALVLKKN